MAANPTPLTLILVNNPSLQELRLGFPAAEVMATLERIGRKYLPHALNTLKPRCGSALLERPTYSLHYTLAASRGRTAETKQAMMHAIDNHLTTMVSAHVEVFIVKVASGGLLPKISGRLSAALDSTHGQGFES